MDSEVGNGEPTETLHCALGEAAWTDLLSNQTQLSGFNPIEDLYPLFFECKIPDKCVSSFLHEATHNICFQSATGYAIAYLHAKMLLDMIGTTDPKSIVKPNWIKIRTFHALMRPISEGLALLCEFDVGPRQSDEIWSDPMWWLYYFTKPQNEQETKSPATFGDALYLRLMKVRQSKNFIRHKQCLLLHPMNVSEGGYRHHLVRATSLQVSQSVPAVCSSLPVTHEDKRSPVIRVSNRSSGGL